MVRMKGAAYSATGLGSVSCKAWGKLNLNSVEPTVDERSEKKIVYEKTGEIEIWCQKIWWGKFE